MSEPRTSTPSRRRGSRGETAADVISFARAVVARLRPALEERLEGLAEQGRSLDELGSVEKAADRMLATVPRASPWNDLLGPFYTTSQVAKLLGGVTRQALADRRKRHTLLGLKTSDGVVVYPAFQFDRENRVLEGIPEVARVLAGSEIDDWTLASWLASPSEALDGRTPVDWLRDGGDLETVLVLARRAASRFAR